SLPRRDGRPEADLAPDRYPALPPRVATGGARHLGASSRAHDGQGSWSALPDPAGRVRGPRAMDPGSHTASVRVRNAPPLPGGPWRGTMTGEVRRGNDTATARFPHVAGSFLFQDLLERFQLLGPVGLLPGRRGVAHPACLGRPFGFMHHHSPRVWS